MSRSFSASIPTEQSDFFDEFSGNWGGCRGAWRIADETIILSTLRS